MSQLIRSFLIGRPRFGSIFWWLLRGYFLRPLSVEIAVFDAWIVLTFYTKTCFRRPLSHLRGFLVPHKMSRNRVLLARRIICGVFFFALISFRIVKNGENMWKHSVFGFFCPKYRTVAQKSPWRRFGSKKMAKTCENTMISRFLIQNVELSLKNRLGGENVELSFENVRKSKKPKGFRWKKHENQKKQGVFDAKIAEIVVLLCEQEICLCKIIVLLCFLDISVAKT